MSPLRALVLEDEWAARNYLVQLLEQSKLAHVVAAVPTTALATAALEAAPEPIDVLFVDITLAGEAEPSQAGLTWLAAVRARPAAPLAVLTTAAREHAVAAFELGALDYLLKPLTAARVLTALQRAAAARPRQGPAPKPFLGRIAARQGRSVLFLEQAEVWAFEAEGRLAFVHGARGRLDIDVSLTSLEAMLGEGYVRVHRNWLVALEAVQAMEREGAELVLTVGQATLKVSVAKDRAAQVRERLLARSVGLRRD